jgi:O-antigen ligase
VATGASDSTHSSPSLRVLVDREAIGALVLAAALPLLFLHERFQPAVELSIGSTSLDVRPSDAAVLAVYVAGLVAASRNGISILGASRLLWASGGLLLVWLAFEAFRPVSTDDALFDDHLVAFGKFVEYALLAVCVPLLVRRARDLALVTWSVVIWSLAATTVAVVQLLGFDIFRVSTSGWRYSSFLGRHDLAALSAIAVSVALAGVVAGRRRISAPGLFWLALAAGALGLVLAGSVAAAGSLVVGAVALALAARRFRPSARQLAALAAIVVAVGGGVTIARSAALEDFLRFVGLHGNAPAQGVETYSQRTVLAYIGLRIFRDNPVLGVGWQRSSRPAVFEEYVPDARKRFPDVVDLAFPARGREWGVQNLYVQMAADAGAIGLALLLLVGVAGLVLAWRAAARAPTPWAAGAGLLVVCALLTLAGEWASLGIVAGIPLQAATCLLLGLAAAGAAAVENEAR